MYQKANLDQSKFRKERARQSGPRPILRSKRIVFISQSVMIVALCTMMASTPKRASADIFEDIGNALIVEAARPFMGEMERMMVQQQGGLLEDTSAAWTLFNNTNQQQTALMINALQNGQTDVALQALAQLCENNSPIRDLLHNGRNNGYGSIIVMAGADASAIVTGGGAVGQAVSISALIHFLEHGEFPNETVAASYFASGTIAVGASLGASFDVAIGFDINQPDEIDGLSIDFSIEFALAAGGNATLSIDPTAGGFQFSGFSIGLNAGAEIQLSVGITDTIIIQEIRDPLNVYAIPGVASAFLPDLTGVYEIRAAGSAHSLSTTGRGSAIAANPAELTKKSFALIRTVEGSYLIQSVATGQYLRVAGDRIAYTNDGDVDDYNRFWLVPDGEGALRIMVKETGRYLHVNEWGDKLVSTRWQVEDDFSRFVIYPPTPDQPNANIAGYWVDDYFTMYVSQNGSELEALMITGSGRVHWLNAEGDVSQNTVQMNFNGIHLTGQVASDGQSVSWSNGVTWRRAQD